jgi:hypothetical protein
MAGMSEKMLDRFARGELPPEESRALAQKALGDDDLFDELTSTAIARHGLATRRRKALTRPRIAILAAAAAVILAVVLYPRQRNARPVKADVATFTPPILLAHNAESNPAAYRGADSETRDSRATGSIESIAGGIATIDLGSVDGLAKDAEVDVVRHGEAIGKIRLTTIFRDHSRGDIAGAWPARAKDQVRVPPLARLRANLDQIEAAMARGETEKAMSIARQASVEGFHADLSRAEDLNDAGVIAELHGDSVKARDFYQRAWQTAPAEEDRQAIEKNLRRVRSGK